MADNQITRPAVNPVDYKFGDANLYDHLNSDLHPNSIFNEALKEIDKAKKNGGGISLVAGSPLYNALSCDFEKGTFIATFMKKEVSTFAINFMHNLIREFSCNTEHEKSLAHLCAMNYG